MTPLAQYLARHLTGTKRDGPSFWSEHRFILRYAISDTQFFDVTAVGSAFHELASMLQASGLAWQKIISDLAFLPAPKTWIEYSDPDGHRLGIFLDEYKNGICRGRLFWRDGWRDIGYCNGPTYADVNGRDVGCPMPAWLNPEVNYLLTAQAHLILINSPKIIGRRTHPPHRGLEKELRKSVWGKFPLHAWTEIKLEVSKPVEIDDGEPHRSVLTGRRALHFVRKHLRVRRGRLEYVASHWRGDASIGIKRSRYVVTA